MGLVFLFAILLYFALLVAATVLGYRYGAKRGWAPGKRRLAAIAGFLIVFLPMFWDWIPTVWAFSYYCDNYAGLTVNKSPEQWNRENPGVAETLVQQSPPLQGGAEEDYYSVLNQRLRRETKISDNFLTIVQYEERVVDSQTGEVLVRYVDFATRRSVGTIQNLRDVKLWINRNSCAPDGRSAQGEQYGKLLTTFKNIGGKK